MLIPGGVFVVTGGASGLGEGTVRALAAKGANVVILDRDVDKAQAIVAELGGQTRRTPHAVPDDMPCSVPVAVRVRQSGGDLSCVALLRAPNTPSTLSEAHAGQHPLNTLPCNTLARPHGVLRRDGRP